MWKQGAWDGLSAIMGRVNAIEVKKVKATFFATIGGGTETGTVSKPAGAGEDVDFVMDEWGTGTDALLSTLANGKPTFRSPEDGEGNVITTTFNAAGEFTFSGTPDPADAVALVYVYTCLLGNFVVSESLLETELLDWVKPHAESHVDGIDDVRDATASVKGLATAAQIGKLDGIEALADVTDSENVDGAGAIMEADYGAQTILRATLDGTPTALTIGEDRIVGRQSGGNIDDLTAAQVRTIAELDGPLSPMILSGGTITAGTDVGTFKVGALTALLRVADEALGVLAYVTKAEEDNIAITVANTAYRVILNYNSGSPMISISESLPNLTQNIPLGWVMKNGGDEIHYIASGHNFADGLSKLHRRAKALRDHELMSGSAIAYSGTNNFTMTIGVAYGGINKFDLAQYNSASTTFVPVRGDGGTGFIEDSPRNTIDFAHYDKGDGTLDTIGVGRYGCHWVYKHVFDQHVYVVYGLDSYKLAEAEVALEPTKPDHLIDFGLLIGCIIAPQAGGSFAEIQMVTDQVFVGTAVATHNNLGGLNDGDYKHLTAAEKTLFDTVESGATKYPDTGEQAFLDADRSKLDGIEAGAKVGDVTASTNLGDHKLVSGDGGAKGIQECSVVVSADGEMTNPSQPAFLAYINTLQENKTGDGTDYNITGAFWTESFDQGNNFLDGTFTAPNTGKYLLSATLILVGITADHTQLLFWIHTSNRNFNVFKCNSAAIKDSGGFIVFSVAITVDMDVNDTAYLMIDVRNGTKVVDIYNDMIFSGALIC